MFWNQVMYRNRNPLSGEQKTAAPKTPLSGTKNIFTWLWSCRICLAPATLLCHAPSAGCSTRAQGISQQSPIPGTWLSYSTYLAKEESSRCLCTSLNFTVISHFYQAFSRHYSYFSSLIWSNSKLTNAKLRIKKKKKLRIYRFWHKKRQKFLSINKLFFIH